MVWIFIPTNEKCTSTCLLPKLCVEALKSKSLCALCFSFVLEIFSIIVLWNPDVLVS